MGPKAPVRDERTMASLDVASLGVDYVAPVHRAPLGPLGSTPWTSGTPGPSLALVSRVVMQLDTEFWTASGATSTFGSFSKGVGH